MFISNSCFTRVLVANQTILNLLKQQIQLRRTGGVHVCNHGTTPLQQNGICCPKSFFLVPQEKQITPKIKSGIKSCSPGNRKTQLGELVLFIFWYLEEDVSDHNRMIDSVYV